LYTAQTTSCTTQQIVNARVNITVHTVLS